MKRIFILILTILVEGFTISFAQGTANYQVKGQIKDARTGETMPLVNVALLRPSDSVFMRGATSDMTGSYAIRDVAAPVSSLWLLYSTGKMDNFKFNYTRPLLILPLPGSLPAGSVKMKSRNIMFGCNLRFGKMELESKSRVNQK